MFLKKKLPFTILCFILIMGPLYFFRSNPSIRIARIFIFGDKDIGNVLAMNQAKMIPEMLFVPNTNTDSPFSCTWAYRPRYAIATYPIPLVDDLDNDGNPEVYIGSHSEELVVLDGRSGAKIWSWKLPFGVIGGRVINLTDLNKDGIKDIIIGSNTTLPIRIYALNGKRFKGNNPEVLWVKNVKGDFFEGGINCYTDTKTREPIIIAATRDAPYSRGTIYVMNRNGDELFEPHVGTDDCISRPAIGKLPINNGMSFITGSHNYYKATFANRINAWDLCSGKNLWQSEILGDGGYQNHQIIDVNFDGKNEVIAFASDSLKRGKQNMFLLNGENGKTIKKIDYYVQGVLTELSQLIVAKTDSSKCIDKNGKVLYTLPKIDFGISEVESSKFSLCKFEYKDGFIKLKIYNSIDGSLVHEYTTNFELPKYPTPTDYGSFGQAKGLSFLSLADADADGYWDAFLQLDDFILNVKTPLKIKKGTDPFISIPFRNNDNGGVLYK